MASRDINLLTPATQDKYVVFREAMTKAGLDFVVICTYRDQNEQNAVWAIDRTIPGCCGKIDGKHCRTWTLHSKHTDGLAFDIEILIDGKGTWDLKWYKIAGEIAKDCGLWWGGLWGDNDHFQSVPNK